MYSTKATFTTVHTHTDADTESDNATDRRTHTNRQTSTQIGSHYDERTVSARSTPEIQLSIHYDCCQDLLNSVAYTTQLATYNEPNASDLKSRHLVSKQFCLSGLILQFLQQLAFHMVKKP